MTSYNSKLYIGVRIRDKTVILALLVLARLNKFTKMFKYLLCSTMSRIRNVILILDSYFFIMNDITQYKFFANYSIFNLYHAINNLYSFFQKTYTKLSQNEASLVFGTV